MLKAILFVGIRQYKMHLGPRLTFYTASSVSAPSNAAPQVVEALRMAGVGGLPDKPDVIPKSDVDSTDRKDQGQVTEAYDPQATSILKPSKDSSNKSKEPATSSRRKNVTFAQGTKLIDATNSKPKPSNNRRSLRNINEIKRRAALTSFPETSVKPNGLSDNNEKKSIGLGIASRTVSAEPYQSISEPFRNPGDDSANYHHKDNTVPSSELEIASETINYFSGFTSGQKKVPIKIEPNDDTVDQDPELGSPILPADESPEDAALRREMLEYSMNLVGNIVAEIDLDEDDDDTSERSYSDGEDGPNSDASSAEEDEDEYGRTKRRVLDDVYLEEMRALERKLNATEIQNIGPQGDIVACTSELVDSRISIDDLLKAESDLHMDRPESKGVRFASEPDVQDSPPTDENNDNIRLVSRPVKDAVIERVKPADVITEPQPETKKKVSRFKRTRNQGPINTEPGQQPGAISNKNTTQHSAATPTPPLNLTATTTENRTITSPSGPPDRTHNPTIIERPYSATTSPHVSLEPDEFDPALIHQQVATEYHRMRNRQIQRQGGFLATDEEKAEVPLTEQEGGGPRVSRFKAARLARLG